MECHKPKAFSTFSFQRGGIMQVICPQCGKVGLLQQITKRYHRVRHSVITQHVTSFGKCFNIRTFTYCRVSTEWAEQQINNEKQKEEAYLKELFERH